MAKFKKKKLQRSKTLGERLQKVRQEAGLSLDEAALETQIRKKYLEALEQGDYSAMPGPVYIESFLKKYAEFLGVSSDFVLSLYHQQDKKSLKKKYQSRLSVPEQSVPQEIITPRLMRQVIIGIIIAVCLTYVGFEVAKIFSPPRLVIISPEDNIEVSQGTIELKGSTEPEVTVTVNGKLIFLDVDGNFSESVSLKQGLNTIIISAKKEKSKESIIERHILFK